MSNCIQLCENTPISRLSKLPFASVREERPGSIPKRWLEASRSARKVVMDQAAHEQIINRQGAEIEKGIAETHCPLLQARGPYTSFIVQFSSSTAY
jgi:hypothetical protein